MLTPVKRAELLLMFQQGGRQPRYDGDDSKGAMVVKLVEHDSALSTWVALQVQKCADAAAMTSHYDMQVMSEAQKLPGGAGTCLPAVIGRGT